MDFEDDMALQWTIVGESIKEAHGILTRLSMNTGKTKYMSYNTTQ